jgi:hypothetical protein
MIQKENAVARPFWMDKPKRSKSLNLESKIQIACVTWFNYQFQEYRGLLFSVPNGGLRNKTTASILKAEGAISGVSDLILMLPNKRYHALCIEMKTDKGKLSDNQEAWRDKALNHGYQYQVCRTIDQFISTVTNYLNS